MSTKLIVVEPTDTTALASQLMLWGGVHHLPVVEGGKLVGIVSDRDLLRAGARSSETLVRDIMTAQVKTASPDTSVDEASAQLAVGQIDCLPVVEGKGKTLKGILTSTDILAERARLVHTGPAAKKGTPTVKDDMRTPVVAMREDDSVGDAIEKMIHLDVRHLPIVDDDRTVVGIVSDRDLRAVVGDPRTAADQGATGWKHLEEVMSTNLVLARQDDDLLAVADMFVNERVGAIPVVDDADRLVGIVSYVDVLAFLVGRRRAA